VDLSRSDQVRSNGPETESAQNGIRQETIPRGSPWFKPDSNLVLKVRFSSKLQKFISFEPVIQKLRTLYPWKAYEI
jgi:hypothetical protein